MRAIHVKLQGYSLGRDWSVFDGWYLRLNLRSLERIEPRRSAKVQRELFQ